MKQITKEEIQDSKVRIYQFSSENGETLPDVYLTVKDVTEDILNLYLFLGSHPHELERFPKLKEYLDKGYNSVQNFLSTSETEDLAVELRKEFCCDKYAIYFSNEAALCGSVDSYRNFENQKDKFVNQKLNNNESN